MNRQFCDFSLPGTQGHSPIACRRGTGACLGFFKNLSFAQPTREPVLPANDQSTHFVRFTHECYCLTNGISWLPTKKHELSFSQDTHYSDRTSLHKMCLQLAFCPFWDPQGPLGRRQEVSMPPCPTTSLQSMAWHAGSV